ncbi:MAG: prepilin-type N-terminal cleavage/methylation domain-containing protein [Planctomycetes bacterium]|nr:prepilin-type N-terminal cleavage/methylation domain-containing protein [Planctomycetota bacterium]
MDPSRRANAQRGFTLVELAVVVVILGVLAAFGVPRFMASVERAKASEAFEFLATVQSAQERYHARQGRYAARVTDLDIENEQPEYFEMLTIKVPTGHTSLETAWTLALVRSGASSGYGAYTVVYDQRGYVAEKSSIPDEINPRRT